MSGSSSTRHPLASGGRRPVQINLNKDDVGNQARYLLNNFIHDRLVEHDGIEDAPAVGELQELGTPTGPPLEDYREIGRAMRCIADELDGDNKLQANIDRLPLDAPQETFMRVAKIVLQDRINWGRIVTLFYFAYKMALRALDRIPLIKAIVNWVITFIVDNFATWIIDRGGWEAIVEYFGTPISQMFAIIVTGVIACGALIAWKQL